MDVHTDFTSGKHTLVFKDGKRIALTKAESIEFEQWQRQSCRRSFEKKGKV